MFMRSVMMTLLLSLLFIPTSAAWSKTYVAGLCDHDEYQCFKAKKGQTWENLFPDEEEREMVRKINRNNLQVRPGMIIAVPVELGSVDFLSLAPFEREIAPQESTLIKVDLSDLAWGAYDESGYLVNWGPISGGKGYCEDVESRCGTITGTFTIQRKQGEGCVSSKYPIPEGGAPMPFCMHFSGGYALHGSPSVPGYHASHGCVRLFVEDAQWLNEEFISVGKTKVEIYR